jgi:hypothetical protein
MYVCENGEFGLNKVSKLVKLIQFKEITWHFTGSISNLRNILARKKGSDILNWRTKMYLKSNNLSQGKKEFYIFKFENKKCIS